jgi:hypothetical protein
MDFKVLTAESALDDLKEIVEFVAKDNREAVWVKSLSRMR